MTIEYRFADSDFNQLPALAAELVQHRVDVIAANGTAAPLAAKALTGTITIVFMAARDPVQSGIVTSLNRPGGNVTGISVVSEELGPKRLRPVHMLLPRSPIRAVLEPRRESPTCERR